MVQDDADSLSQFYDFLVANVPNYVSPHPADWDGYQADADEIVAHWIGYRSNTGDDRRSVNSETLVLDTTPLRNSRTAIHSLVAADIRWYAMKHSFDLRITNGSLAGGSLGEYYFLTDGETWKILKNGTARPVEKTEEDPFVEIPEAWNDPTLVLQSGTFPSPIVGVWQTVSLRLQSGIFTVSVNGQELGALPADTAWVDRHVSIVASGRSPTAGSSVRFRRVSVKTREFDQSPPAS